MNGSHDDSDELANNPAPLPANGSTDATLNSSPPPSNSPTPQPLNQPSPPGVKRVAGSLGISAAPVSVSAFDALDNADPQQAQVRITQLQTSIEQALAQINYWLQQQEQEQAPPARSNPVTPKSQVTSADVLSADFLATQILQTQRQVYQWQQQIEQMQRQLQQHLQQMLAQEHTSSVPGSVPIMPPATMHATPPPATPTNAMGEALSQQQAQPPRVVRRARPQVSTALLPRRAIALNAGQAPSFRESLLTILVVGALFLFVVGAPIAAATIIIAPGIAGKLLSALSQPTLPTLLVMGTGLVLALLVVLWVELILELRVLTQVFGASLHAIRNRGASQPPRQQQRITDSDANSLASEPPDISQQDTKLMAAHAADGADARPTGGRGGQVASPAPSGVAWRSGTVEAAHWEKRPKSDPTDPVEDADQIALPTEKFQGQWAIIGSSRIGKGHEHDGKYREDSLGAAIAGNWQMAAVADGGGAYKLARVGARVATEGAIAAMKQRVEPGAVPARQDAQAFIASVLIAGIRAGYQALYSEVALRQKAGEQVTVKDMRTTLLLLLRCESRKPKGQWVGGIQVGDGIIVARDGKGTLHWLGTPDTGPSGNEVLFLTDAPNTEEEWERRKRVVFIKDEPLHCLAMTDGVADDLLPIDSYLGVLEKPLYDNVLPGRSPREAAQALAGLLEYDRSGSFDDRTLVCIYKVG